MLRTIWATAAYLILYCAVSTENTRFSNTAFNFRASKTGRGLFNPTSARCTRCTRASHQASPHQQQSTNQIHLLTQYTHLNVSGPLLTHRWPAAWQRFQVSVVCLDECSSRGFMLLWSLHLLCYFKAALTFLPLGGNVIVWKHHISILSPSHYQVVMVNTCLIHQTRSNIIIPLEKCLWDIEGSMWLCVCRMFLFLQRLVSDSAGSELWLLSELIWEQPPAAAGNTELNQKTKSRS